MIAELCKGVHCVDLGESFQTHIFLQKFASIQPRTSPLKFARPSVEVSCGIYAGPHRAAINGEVSDLRSPVADVGREAHAAEVREAVRPQAEGPEGGTRRVVANFWQIFGKMLLVFGCVDRHRFLQVNIRFAAFFKIYHII